MEKIERLIRINVEIEGLLRVLSSRDNTSIRAMLTDKFADFSALFNDFMIEEKADADIETPAESVTTAECLDALANAESKEENNESCEDNFIIEDAMTEPETALATETESSKTTDENLFDEAVSADVPTAETVTDDIVATDKEPVQDVEGKEQTVEKPLPDDATIDFDASLADNEIVPVELGDFPDEDEVVDNHLTDSVPQSAEDPVDEAAQIPESGSSKSVTSEPETPTLGDRLSEEIPSEIRVDEMIARRAAGDLTKAFTLNDKIRFRRSLFASNADDFANVLANLSAVETYRDAIGYLTTEKGWDISNPEVEEFLTIIRPHYPKED